MFSFTKRGRAKKSIEAAVQRIVGGDLQAGQVELEEAVGVLGAEGLSLAAEHLLEAELFELGMGYAERALAVESPDWDDLATAVELAQHLSDGKRELELLATMHALRPSQLLVAEALVRALLAQGDANAAVVVLDALDAELESAELTAARGEAYMNLQRPEDALPLLQSALDELEGEVATSGSAAKVTELQAVLAPLVKLHEEALLAVHGEDALAEQSAARDAQAAASTMSYRQAAAEVVTDWSTESEVFDLDDIDAGDGEALDLLFIDEEDLRGLCLQGIASLRSGDARTALPLFTRALQVDGGHVPAILGQGAANALARGEMTARIWTLPELPEPPGLREVVPDFEVMGDLERRVVISSLHPLRSLLPELARKGSVLRVLPLDVRPADHPGQREATGAGPEGCEHEGSGSGLSSASHAVMKVEDLLDVDPDTGWVLAHQFCHLVHLALPGTLGRAERPAEERGTLSSDECLSLDYVEYLCRRYDFVFPEDEHEALPAHLQFFDELAGRDTPV